MLTGYEIELVESGTTTPQSEQSQEDKNPNEGMDALKALFN